MFMCCPPTTPSGTAAHRDGYSLIWDTLDGERAAIVSDLDDEELAKFRQLLDQAK